MEDWHQACCRKRPLRASQAPTNRPSPMKISRTRTKLAAPGAAVPKNPSFNRLSPRRLPTALRPCLGKNLARQSGTVLSRSIHSTEKAAEVSRQCDDDYGHSLDRQTVSGQDLFVFPWGSPMDEPHEPDQDA